MHDVSNNSSPANISNLFLYPTQVLSDNFIFGAKIWNSIPQSIRILPKHKFKDSLHQLLLRILELEDTYVDTPTLVNK